MVERSFEGRKEANSKSAVQAIATPKVFIYIQTASHHTPILAAQGVIVLFEIPIQIISAGRSHQRFPQDLLSGTQQQNISTQPQHQVKGLSIRTMKERVSSPNYNLDSQTNKKLV